MACVQASDRAERFEKDVFLVHSGQDEDAAKYIYKELLDSGLKCVAQFDEEAFRGGGSIFDQIVKWIKSSWRTVLLITQKSKNSTWVNLETLLAIEQSQHRPGKEVPLRIVYIDIPKKEIPLLQSGHFNGKEGLVVNFNKKNWKDNLIKGLKGRFFCFDY